MAAEINQKENNMQLLIDGYQVQYYRRIAKYLAHYLFKIKIE